MIFEILDFLQVPAQMHDFVLGVPSINEQEYIHLNLWGPYTQKSKSALCVWTITAEYILSHFQNLAIFRHTEYTYKYDG